METDETFIALSFKGNHRRDRFKMPRGVHKRGRAASGHNPLVCVITAIDRESDNCGVVSNLGKPSKVTRLMRYNADCAQIGLMNGPHQHLRSS